MPVDGLTVDLVEVLRQPENESAAQVVVEPVEALGRAGKDGAGFGRLAVDDDPMVKSSEKGARYAPPESPEVKVNTAALSAREAARLVVDQLEEQGLIPGSDRD